jgi:Mycothiol maleylpyruvate isomerase N-terminal domain
VPDDPELGARVRAATSRLLQTAAGITDEQARELSLLPGWSRGHVLTAEITGPTRDLLAWLTGRDAGRGLTAEPVGPLPPLPPW